ncbi:MAG: site-2 protease family protein [Dehalococcoidales bacterium]|nr:site-2 protease family protein [Dehalococcoidales bacterium]
MGKTFKLGKLFGIQFGLHFSWFIIFILITASLVHPDYSDWFSWFTAISTSLLLFASVVAHELAHSLVGRANGIPVKSITLFIFGGVAQMTREAARPGAELKMAVAGPASSLIIGAFFSLLWLLLSDIMPGPIAVMLLGLAVINIGLALFNLVPGFPLDGGRVFRSILWYTTGNYIRSSRIAIRLGQGIGYLLMLGGIAIIFLRPFGFTWFDGIWIAFIGWFLASIASISYRQINRQEELHSFTTPEAEAPHSSGSLPSGNDINQLN